MEATKIIVWTNPTAPFQKVYALKDGEMVDQMGVKFDDLEEVITALCSKYEIFQIDFSGSRAYGEKIGNILNLNGAAYYNLKTDFNIHYI